MTGFGRGVTTTNHYQLTVEMRSVNHRFLEISTKFPKDWVECEVVAKKIVTEMVARGKIDILIFLKELQAPEQKIEINWPLLHAYKNVKEQLADVLPMQEQWTMEEISKLENVLSIQKQQLAQEDITSAVEQAVREAAVNLLHMRVREGEELKAIMLQYQQQLQQQVTIIRQTAPTAVSKYRERLLTRLKEISESSEVDERIVTEVAIYAERVDISEELDRLESHFVQLLETLDQSDTIGRKLDFIMQEMHREINTIGSKNQSADSSIAVVQAKTILEKMREQVQNIE
jgi:uncharacterized protein (TIGR00255 family)